MDALGHDLLLLMLNLSRMRDRAQILRLFVEALAAARPELRVRLLAEGEACPEGGEEVEIATPEARFGRLLLEAPPGLFSERDRARYRNATRMLAVVLENIARAERLATENARLDAAVEARTAELRQALAVSEDLYQLAPCAYHSVDAAGLIVRVNDTELRWLGYTRDELVGRVQLADLMAPECRESFLAAFRAVRDQGSVDNVELTLIRKDGSRLPVLGSATAVRDAEGNFVMSRSTMYDLSERRQTEQVLREAQERSRQALKLEALGRLAGGVAHDFNNLLTVILSAAEFLQEDLPPGDPRRQEADEILEAGRRAARLTQQLLAFGRRQPSRPVPVDLGEVVAGMEKMLRRLIGEDVELEVERIPGLWPVRADPGQLEQVVLNLVVNARDAMPEGGRIRVATGNVPPGEGGAGERVRLAVRDCGVGMSDEVRAHLFEPFFTTKLGGRGTGLGLATVYGIVKQAGGDVRVDSAPGEGTCFEVLFPRAETAAEEEEEEEAPADAAGAAPGGETILLVEDEPRVRSTTAQVLRRAGYTVLEAVDGEEALEVAARAPRLDLVVSDLVMPRLGGIPMAVLLRAQRGDVPVLFLSGYAGEARHSEGLDAQAVAFLQKPFSAADLARAVRERLAARPRGPDAPAPPAPPDASPRTRPS
ncbi:MAG: response regulator [Deltaproteobacteria bacterium]|nr:response regulator [Deltaproteobacteria bacterium]